jgi:hypothetical protein
MGSLRITAPSAVAAFVLVEKLGEYGATAGAERTGDWVIELPLLGAPRETIPRALAAAREWLDECSIASAAVSFDGHTHLLRGTASLDAALQERASHVAGRLVGSTSIH